MPINFQPAAPFSPAIAEKFGETEQWNRIAPLLAQQYQAAANRRSAESIATAQNQTSASSTSAQLQGRKQAQDTEIDAERQQQGMQIAAQMEMQQRAQAARLAEQQMENDRFNFAITRQEEQENVARMNGLAEIEKMMADETMSKEDGGLARLQLVGKIKAFENRRMSQQAQALEQQAQMQAKVYADNQKNIAEAQMFGKATAGQNWFPVQQGNGDVEFYGYDPQKGTYYQIGKRSAGEQKPEQVSPYADESGGFSYKKALPEAEAEAKVAYPAIKDDTGKDTNERARAEYMQEMVKKREDEHRAGMNRGQQPSAAPGAQQSPQKMQIESRLTAIQQQYPDISKAPPAVQQEARQLYQQYKSQ